MTGRYLTGMAGWLRGAGLGVVEYDGWQTRARSSGGYANGRPWGVMWHHTASSTDPADDAAYMCHGSPDRPIANLLVARDGAVWVLAAGATNTNGKGGPWSWSRGTVPKDSMNTYAVGVEIANAGTGETFPAAQIDAAFTVSVTLAAALGLDPGDVATHQTYAPDRKIDPATAAAVVGSWQPRAVTSSGSWAVDDLVTECRHRGYDTPPVPPDPPWEDDTMLLQVIGDSDRGGPAVAAAPGYWQPINDEQLHSLTTAGYCDGLIHMVPARVFDVLQSLFLYGSTTWQQPLADLVHGTTPTAGEMISGIHYETVQR